MKESTLIKILLIKFCEEKRWFEASAKLKPRDGSGGAGGGPQ